MTKNRYGQRVERETGYRETKLDDIARQKKNQRELKNIRDRKASERRNGFLDIGYQ
jgi:hypothetical protein